MKYISVKYGNILVTNNYGVQIIYDYYCTIKELDCEWIWIGNTRQHKRASLQSMQGINVSIYIISRVDIIEIHAGVRYTITCHTIDL